MLDTSQASSPRLVVKLSTNRKWSRVVGQATSNAQYTPSQSWAGSGPPLLPVTYITAVPAKCSHLDVGTPRLAGPRVPVFGPFRLRVQCSRATHRSGRHFAERRLIDTPLNTSTPLPQGWAAPSGLSCGHCGHGELNYSVLSRYRRAM
jgi:hypothetical protein